MPSLSAAIFVYINNAINQRANKKLILIGRIFKQESDQNVTIRCLLSIFVV